MARDEGSVIYRFIGATPDSSSGHALLESLCRQISRNYGANQDDIPLEYREFVQEFPKRLALATAENPLILFLDALDQLSIVDNARSLAWLPAQLPQHVRLVVSTLPDECLEALHTKLPQEHFIELEPMPYGEAKTLLDLWLQDAGRTLQPIQRDHVLSRYTACPNPLYLKLAFEEARRWHSYDGVPLGADDVSGLSEDIPGIIQDLFVRLSDQANHGEVLVSRSLGYLAASKNGLTEDEMLDLLARDVDVYAWFLRSLYHTPSDLLQRVRELLEAEQGLPVSEAAADTWLRQLRQLEFDEQLRALLSNILIQGDGIRLPVVLWSRLYADLEPYLVQRSADGASLMAFYHPTTFGKAVKETFLDEDKSKARHRALAGYFEGQPLLHSEDGGKKANLRKMSELPFQQTHALMWQDLKTTLSSIDFLGAKVDAVDPQALIADFELAYQKGYPHEDLRQIQGSLQLCAHILTTDSSQMAGQLLGRLQASSNNVIQSLMDQARFWSGIPWLQPQTQSLTMPGGALLRTITGHQGKVTAVAALPDCQRFISGATDGYLKIWDLENGEMLDSLNTAPDMINAIAITPDGKRFLYGGHFGGITLRELDTRQYIESVGGDFYPVSFISIIPGGRSAIFAHGSKATVFDLDTFQVTRNLQEEPGAIHALAPFLDGQYLAADSKNEVLIWDLTDGTVVNRLAGHTDDIQAIIIHPSGLVISGSRDRTIKIWDPERGTELASLVGHRGSVTALAALPGGRIISGSTDKTLKVWNLTTGKEVCTFRGHNSAVLSIAVTPDGKAAISGSWDSIIKVWDLVDCDLLTDARTYYGPIFDLQPVGGGSRAISGSDEGALKIWDPRTGRSIDELISQSEDIRAIAVSADGARAICGSQDGVLEHWDLNDGVLLHSWKGHDSAVRSVVILNNGKQSISVSNDRTLRVWDLADYTERLRIRRDSEICDVAVLSDDRRVIYTSEGFTLNIWDLITGQELVEYKASSPIQVFAVSPNEQQVVFAGCLPRTMISRDLRVGQASKEELLKLYALTVWDLVSHEPLFTLEGHLDQITGVVFLDHNRVVSSSFDGTIKIWDLDTRQAIASFQCDYSPLCCAVTPYELTVIAGDEGGNLHVLQLVERGRINQSHS